MNLTEHQYKAIFTHDLNLVVTAGAGSGKTRVLVERYLALLDKHPEWDLNALVAITFTSKAAQEMRDRVRLELEKRLRTVETAADAQRWSNLLAQMESARIDTIHALCASILRANAAEAGIDPAFRVLDEIQATILLEDTIDAAFQQLVNEGHPAVALFSIYDDSMIRQSLNQELIGADISDLSADLFANWQQQWSDYATSVLTQLLNDSIFVRFSQWQPPHSAREDKLYLVWESCRLELETITHSESLPARLGAIRALTKAIKVNVGSKAAWGGDEYLKEAKDYLRLLREAANAADESVGEPPNDLDREAARLLPYWLELARRVQILFRQAKAREGLLDFNDLENRARNLLTQNRHVRERYRGREFKHVLVDEFQDTNEAQWDIVRALADPTHSGSLFIVGDEKQSIYAFRGADVRVFGAARETIVSAGGLKLPLAQSFRTHKPLVDSFNSLFSQLLFQSSADRHYEVAFDEGMTAARTNPPHDAPTMELLLIDKSQLKDEPDKTQAARRWEAYEIAQRLQALVGDKTLIYDKEERIERAVTYGDMALLFQSMGHVTLYEEVFKALGIPFLTVAGRGYYDRQEVWDVINLLTVLHNPPDNLALASVLRSPMFSLSDDALLALRLLRDDDHNVLPLWDALNLAASKVVQLNVYVPPAERVVIATAYSILSTLKHIAGRVTISELLREALARTGYLATLSGLPDGARKRANVEKLIDKAQSTGQVTLGAFQQYLKDLSAREVREGEAAVEGAGVVTLMTVHASKGLEFPVVVLPDCSWENKGGRGSMLIYDERVLACKVYDEAESRFVASFPYRRLQDEAALRDKAERKRLLYVAATRAQDMLIVSGHYNVTREGRISDTGLWLKWLLESLKISDWEQGESVRHYDWGTLRLYNPTQPPSSDVYMMGANEKEAVWDSVAVQGATPMSGNPQQPPLLAKVRVARDRRARNLSATQIADLGSAEYDTYFQQKLRRSIQHDAPASVDQVSERTPKVSGRVLGDIVHEALRWWRFPSKEDNLEDMLQNYAWDEGIIEEGDRRFAVNTARRWLIEIMDDPIYPKVENARQVFRELPMIYKTDKRTIHGIIDMLLQEADGTWSIVDYKTSYVDIGLGKLDPNLLEAHARRYHLQLGVYAEAVRAQIGGQSPRAYIHYLRYRRTVEIAEAEWRSALTKLEDHIGKFMWEESDVE